MKLQFKELLVTFLCLGIEIAAHCDYLFKLRLSKFSYEFTYLQHRAKYFSKTFTKGKQSQILRNKTPRNTTQRAWTHTSRMQKYK